MKTIKRIAALAAIVSLAACGGGGGGTVPATASPTNGLKPYNGPASLANFTWGSTIANASTYVGPANFPSMTVNVQLAMQNEQGLYQYAHAASDPSSALYRHWLSPQEIGVQYGASQSAVDAASTYFQKYGLATGTWPQHLMMVVTGTQAQLESAFGTKFGVYRGYGQQFVAPTQQPHFSQPVPVMGVLGLVHTNLERVHMRRSGNGNLSGMSPQQLRRAFDLTGAAQAGYDGTGTNVGIIGTGPIWPGDTPAIGQRFNTKVAPVTIVAAAAQPASPANNGTGTGLFDDPTGLATPPPVNGAPGCGNSMTPVFPTATCNPLDGEAQIDTQAAAELAPGANVLFYLAFNNKDCAEFAGFCPTGAIGVQGLYLTDDEIQQAIADNKADTLSLSYGLPEPSGVGFYYSSTGSGPGPLEFAALAAEGIATFVSSGDNGAYECVDPATGAPTATKCVSYPASDPSVVAVGAVNVPMDNTGALPPGTSITAWGGNTTAGGDGLADNSPGSAGGISAVFSSASVPWQTGTNVIAGGRNIPDVSMDGDPLTGPLVLEYAGYQGGTGIAFSGGGTSESAPEMAGAWAVVLQACKASSACNKGGATGYRLGNPAGLFWKNYNSTSYGSTFFDVLAGNNGANSIAAGAYLPGYNVGPNYDLVTGIGVPFIGHMINYVITNAGGANPNVP